MAVRLKPSKAAYASLISNPKALCPPGPSSSGADVIIFPNGACEIWAQTHDGLGVRIVIGEGPHGLSVRVGSFVATPKLTSDLSLDSETEITVTQYREDPRSQAFKRWYRHRETPADVELLGPEYQRKANDGGR